MSSEAVSPVDLGQPAAAAVAQALRELILKGRLSAGTPLRQDALGKQFGVSQVTVREALRVLAEEELVRVVPRKGAVVFSLSPDEAAEITLLRTNLEGELITASIPRLASHDFAAAQKIISLIDAAPDVEALLPLNTEFHKILYAKAGLPRTTAIVDRLRVMLEPYLRLLWKKTGYQRTSQKDHRELVALCKSGKAKEARLVLRRHIEKTGKQIEDLLRSQE